MGKAELTSEYILKVVAPYFNKHGYHATSMSDITRITGLTKGAIYGNFANKENLALEAFRYNVRKVINEIAKAIEAKKTAPEKLFAVTSFYRRYIDYTKEMGGCPIVRVGLDSMNNNDLLAQKVQRISIKLKSSLVDIVEQGKAKGEIKDSVSSSKFVNILFSMIDGAILNTSILANQELVDDCMDHLDQMIIQIGK